MNKKEVLFNKIDLINGELVQVFNSLKELNTDDNQFDYCNSPVLSNKVDQTERMIKLINNIVYQRSKSL